MRKQQTLFAGAAILAGAGVIVKVIGACFKIPLGAILQPEGIAVFSVAYNLYALLFALATSGVPVAVSKQVAEAAAYGRYAETVAVVQTALMVFVPLGLAGSGVLWFGSAYFANAMGIPDAEAAIQAIAPAVFFVSLLSVLRGYYQGFRDMVPTATSEVIEALVKMLLGLFLAWYLRQNGHTVEFQAAGALCGVTAGTALACLYLCLLRRRVSVAFPKKPQCKISRRNLLKTLFSQTVPITLSAAVIGLTNVIDSGLIMKLLQRIGYSVADSMRLYGTYTYATNIFNLPNVLISTLAVSLIPTAAEAVANENRSVLSQTKHDTLSVTALLSCAAASGLAALAYPTLDLLYGRGVEAQVLREAGTMLTILCAGIPPLAIATMTNALHQATGRAKIPMLSMAIGAGVKLAANAILVQIPNINIFGAAVSTVLCYTVVAGINWCFLYDRDSLRSLLKRPIVVGICTGTVAKIVYSYTKLVFFSEIAVLLSVFCGGITFFCVGNLLKCSLFFLINAKKYSIKTEKIKFF